MFDSFPEILRSLIITKNARKEGTIINMISKEKNPSSCNMWITKRNRVSDGSPHKLKVGSIIHKNAKIP